MAIALTIGATLSLPLFVASTAARLTVSYARSQEYPLLCVTALPDRRIVSGYVLTVLRYTRSPMALILGMAPAFGVVFTYFTWVYTSSYHSPWTWYDGMIAHTDLGVVGIVLKHALITISLGLGLFGINLLATTLGVGFGLWWRSATPAVGAALMTIVGSTAMTSYVVLRAVAALDIPDAFLRHLLQYALFAPFPYLLSLGCTRLARRWARRPGQHPVTEGET